MLLRPNSLKRSFTILEILASLLVISIVLKSLHALLQNSLLLSYKPIYQTQVELTAKPFGDLLIKNIPLTNSCGLLASDHATIASQLQRDLCYWEQLQNLPLTNQLFTNLFGRGYEKLLIENRQYFINTQQVGDPITCLGELSCQQFLFELKDSTFNVRASFEVLRVIESSL